MKSIIFFVLFLVIADTQFTLAQIPQTMSYQGILTGTSSTPVPDGTVSLTFRLYDSSENSDTLWQETQSVQVTNGIFNVILGSSNPLNLPFDKQYWLGITISGGTELTPRVMLTASPYSLNSHSTIAETEPGQGLTIRDSNGNPTHQLDANGDVTHNGVGKFLGGIVVGDTIVVVDTGNAKTTNLNFLKNEKITLLNESLPNIGISTAGSKIGVVGYGGEMGLYGQSKSGSGLFGISESGDGILGKSSQGSGVYGHSVSASGISGYSQSYIGVHGISDGLVGVYGTSPQIGVEGQSDGGTGVHGQSVDADGILGESYNSTGVYGRSVMGTGIMGEGELGGHFINKVQLDEVPEAQNQENFLVWDDDNIVKYRTLPVGGSFDGILHDIPLVVKNGQTEVFRVDIDGSSFHEGLETFYLGIELPDYNIEHLISLIKAGKFNQADQLSANAKLNSVSPLSLDMKKLNSKATTPNEPVIWGYTERVDGAGVLGQSNNTSNTYPANWGVNFGGGAGVVGEVRNTGSNYPAIWALQYGTGSGLLIDHHGSSGNIFTGRSAGVNQVRIDKTGKGFFNGGTQTGGADVAEAIEVEGVVNQYEPGDVMVVSTERNRTVTKSNKPYSTLVVGVYATKPGVLLSKRNIDDSHIDTVPLGVVGIIPTKVCIENGPIKRGDLLVTSSQPGCAMKGTDREKLTGAVIGKAFENFDGTGTGIIEVLVNTK